MTITKSVQEQNLNESRTGQYDLLQYDLLQLLRIIEARTSLRDEMV